jgi:hypothetical protein
MGVFGRFEQLEEVWHAWEDWFIDLGESHTTFPQTQLLSLSASRQPPATWLEFRGLHARYEPLIAVLGRMTDAPRSDWSSWSDAAPRHSPPLLRLRRCRLSGQSRSGGGLRSCCA